MWVPGQFCTKLRCGKHFTSNAFFAARALAPDSNISNWSEEDRNRLQDLTSTFFMQLLAKMGHGPEVLVDLRADVGKWVLRTGSLSMPNPVPLPLVYWHSNALTIPLLTKVALTIFSIVPSEAAVERSFSHQSLLHTDLRNKLHEDTIHDVQVVPSIL